MLNVLEVISENTTLCGGIEIPNEMFNLVALIIKGIKIVVPILLIIWGMLDFAKSVIAKSEDDVKKFRKAFISRLISAVLVFLMVVIVQLLVNMLSGVEQKSNESGETSSDIWSCSKKFIQGVESVESPNAPSEEGTEAA